MRDLLIGAPVFWIQDARVPVVCLAVALFAWFTPTRWWEGRFLSIADGLGLFARWRLASLSASEASKHAVRYLFTHIVMKGEAATGAGSPAESARGDTSCLVRPLMLKRCAILAPLMLARCALALRGAPALIAPSMRGAARRLPRAPRPFASPLVARLSQGVEQAEKSDEEKARLKAEREERKEAKRLAAEEKKAAKEAEKRNFQGVGVQDGVGL